MPTRRQLAGGAGAALVPPACALAGFDLIALLLLVAIVPFALAFVLRWSGGRPAWSPMGVAVTVLFISTALVFAEYRAADRTASRDLLERSQALGLTIAVAAGLVAAGGGHAIASWMSRRSERNRTTTGSLSQAMAATDSAQLIAGRYRLERPLGRGGMGTVYEAHDLTLDRRVAVKLVRDELAGQPGAVERFEREARAAARFNHPHVVTVFDYGVSGSQAYLVMERLEGQTLRDALAAGGLDVARALRLLREVGAAIDAAHAQRLLHLDLKPENIFLVTDRTDGADDASERAKVLDFGVARLLKPLNPLNGAIRPAGPPAGPLIGTPAYMAPEQLRGEGLDAAADLWALAVIAYEALTGIHPFAAVTWQADGFAGSGNSESIGQLRPAVSGFFARALAIDRARRPVSANALVTELAQHLANGSTNA